MARRREPLTINGIHLNAHGDGEIGRVLDAALFGPRPADSRSTWKSCAREVNEKNLQFFYDYRAVNGCYIYGGRKKPFGVVNFPAEFAKLRKMIANRDARDLGRGRAAKRAGHDRRHRHGRVHQDRDERTRSRSSSRRPRKRQAHLQTARGLRGEPVRLGRSTSPICKNPVAMSVRRPGPAVGRAPCPRIRCTCPAPGATTSC